jgi:folate-binding protein YgfZ
MYKLRSKVELLDETDKWYLVSIQEKQAEKFSDIWFPDPRHPALGFISVCPAAIHLPSDWTDYPTQRMALGIPDGQRDIKVDKGIILENNLDELHAIDWKKGCYMGQELMSRTKHVGQIRKRLLPVRIEGAVPPLDSDIMFEGEKVGEMRGVDCTLDPTIGLALLRLEYVEKSLKTAQPLQGKGGALLCLEVPEWLKAYIPSI